MESVEVIAFKELAVQLLQRQGFDNVAVPILSPSLVERPNAPLSRSCSQLRRRRLLVSFESKADDPFRRRKAD